MNAHASAPQMQPQPTIAQMRLALAQKVAEVGFWQQRAGELEVAFIKAQEELEALRNQVSVLLKAKDEGTEPAGKGHKFVPAK